MLEGSTGGIFIGAGVRRRLHGAEVRRVRTNMGVNSRNGFAFGR